MKKKKQTKQQQKQQIIWNVVNSILAGGLVLLGNFTSGSFSFEGLCIAIATAGAVALTKFNDFWKSEQSEYCGTKLFSFVK